MAAYQGRGVHGKTVEDLGTRIVSGELAQGETLDIAGLGQELDVSLTALREALKVLAAKGLLDARQKRGTFVTPRASWNLLDADVMRWEFAGARRAALFADLAEVRGAVEPACADAAARRRTPQDVAAMEGALDDMAQAHAAGDPVRAAAADLAFHRALYAATHNELFTRMDLFIEAPLAERDRVVHAAQADDPVPVHRAVFEAVRDGDPGAAREAVAVLLEKSAKDLSAVMEDGGPGR